MDAIFFLLLHKNIWTRAGHFLQDCISVHLHSWISFCSRLWVAKEWMHRLIWFFTGCTCSLVGNAVSWFIWAAMWENVPYDVRPAVTQIRPCIHTVWQSRLRYMLSGWPRIVWRNEWMIYLLECHPCIQHKYIYRNNNAQDSASLWRLIRHITNEYADFG